MERVEQKKYVIGIDEVGRGPIAGPLVVCAAAVKEGVDILQYFPGQILKDSKKLTKNSRMKILKSIESLEKSKMICFGLGEIPASRIDQIGLTDSISEALETALDGLHTFGVPKDTFVYLDGSLKAPESYSQKVVIKGDEKIPEIAIASIYAKEYRDAKMEAESATYPLYLFEKHVGYGTKKHYEAIKAHGITVLHRKSFLKGRF